MTVVGHKTLGNGPRICVADVDEPVRAAGHEEAGRVGAPDRAVADAAVPLEAANLSPQTAAALRGIGQT